MKTNSFKKLSALLLSLSLSASTSITALAHTNDDVRRLLGLTEVDTAEFHDYVNYIDEVQQSINGAQSTTPDGVDGATDVTQPTINLESSLAGRVKQVSLTQQELSQQIASSLSSGTLSINVQSDSTRLARLTESLDTFKNLNYFSFIDEATEPSAVTDGSTEQSQSAEDINTEHSIDWYFDPANINEIQQALAYRRTLMNDTYDIGLIGTVSNMSPIATTSIEVTTGFHGRRQLDTPQDTQSSNGVYLKSSEKSFDYTTQAVKSLFNGVVTQVHHSEVYGNWLEIQSGKGLKISYSFLGNIFPVPGDTVQQGEIIGYGSSLNGEIYIEAILDNEYINPCLLMGEAVYQAHNDWKNSNTSDSLNSELITYKTVPLPQDTSIWDELLDSGNVVDFYDNKADAPSTPGIDDESESTSTNDIVEGDSTTESRPNESNAWGRDDTYE